MADQPKAPMLLSFSCPVKLQDMEGDDQVRKCDRCSCSVQNITDYSLEQLEDLQQRVDAGEKLCVSFSRPVAPAAQSPLSRPVIRISIAVAASITLAYYAPAVTAPVLAQQPALTTCSDSKTASTSANLLPIGRKSFDAIQLTSEEHGLWAGRPAPSVIRDLVNDISYYHEGLFDYLAYSKRVEFKEKADHGQISVAALESLAQSYDFHGPASQARKCYALLVALADRENPTEQKLKQWKVRVQANAISEYKNLLSQCDQHVMNKKVVLAIQDLEEAEALRRSSLEMIAKFPFTDILTRFDSMPVNTAPDRQSYLNAAFQLAGMERPSPAIEAWLKPKVGIAVAQYDYCVTQVAKSIAQHQYDEAIASVEGAITIGTMDPRVEKCCNWKPLTEHLTQISKAAPTLSVRCAELKKCCNR